MLNTNFFEHKPQKVTYQRVAGEDGRGWQVRRHMTENLSRETTGVLGRKRL